MGLISRLTPGSARRKIRFVLIVEDEPLVAFDNEHALEQAGYRVVDTVDRYLHAAEVLAKGGVDLVVADIRLTGVRTGIDVARTAAERRVPVLFSTAACPDEAQGFGLGWLAKPYGPRDLVRSIQYVDALLAGKKADALPDRLTLFAR